MPPFLPILPLFFATACAAPLIWLGNLTSTSFTLHADIPPTATHLILTAHATNRTILARTSATAIAPLSIYAPLHRYVFTSLSPSTPYIISLLHTNASTTLLASVTTFPTTGTPSSLTLLFASCQLRPSMYRSIPYISAHLRRATHPALFIHMGDMAYADITVNDPSLYHLALRRVLTSTPWHALLSHYPLAYMYDDHDFGPNNADATSPSAPAALANYRALVPSYPLPDPGASYHAFTIATIRIILTDLRAKALPNLGSTLGTRQRAWLLSELSRAARYSLVVWVSTKPWIGSDEGGSDSWAAYHEERQLIATEIAIQNVSNLVMLAGDAHMLAADNGSNSDYSSPTSTGGGFPVFQAAPLAHIGSGKGGPYSQGCFAYRFYPNFHYGMLEVTKVNESDGPCVRFSGYRVGRDGPLINFERCGVISAVNGVGGQDTRCAIPLFPPWVWVVIALGLCLIVMLIFFGCWRIRRCRSPKEEVFVNDGDNGITLRNSDTASNIDAGSVDSVVAQKLEDY